MKVDERRLPELARELIRGPGTSVFLIHGDDPVLVAARARVALQIAGSAAQGPIAFDTVELDGSQHGRLLEELNSPILGGGRVVVRLRDATDSATASVQAALREGGSGVLVIEAAALSSRSRLRVAVEANERGFSVLCRGEDARELAAAVDHVLSQLGMTIDADARKLLIQRAAGFGGTLHDAEKVALLVSGEAPVTVADVLLLDQDSAGGVLEEFLFAAGLGRVREVDRLMEELFADGAAPAALLRAMLGHLSRVRMARLAIDEGDGLQSAVASLRPPVFFRRTEEMRKTVASREVWQLDRFCEALWHADRACRETAMPHTAICRRVVARMLHGS